MADGHTTSPTSFALGSDPHANAAEALRLLAASQHVSPGFRLALNREIAALDHQAREAARYRGVAPSGLGPDYREARPLEAIRAEGRQFDDEFTAYRNSPVGKARRVIAEAQRTCEQLRLARVYAAFEAVANSLSRGDADPQIFVDKLQGVLAAIDDIDVSDLQVMATELRVYVAEIA